MLSKKGISILTSIILILFFSVLNLPVLSSASEDNVSPILTTAIVDGTLLVLSYDEALDTGSIPVIGDFTVKINGAEQTGIISSAAISSDDVNITLNNAVTQTDTVLLSYVPGTNPIKDLAANQAAAFTDQQVTNNTLDVDTAAPIQSSATITGTLITISYDEALDVASVPAAGDLTVKINGAEQTGIISSAAISSNDVNITLNNAVTQTDTVLLSYVPGSNPIKDLAGNQAAAFADQQVTNNTAGADTTAPVQTAATIIGTLITISYDEALDATSVPAAGDFTVKINGTEQTGIISSAAINGNNVNITLNTAVTQMDTVLLSYVPGTDPIKDLAGNQAAAFTDQQVTNNTAGDITAPICTAVNLSGKLISVVYNETLSTASIPSPGAFVIKINDIEQVGIISNIAVGNNIVYITVNKVPLQTDVVLLSYIPGLNPIKDVARNLADGFTDATAIHNDKHVQYEYDDANQLRYIRVNTGEVYEFQYDVNGNLIRRTRIN